MMIRDPLQRGFTVRSIAFFAIPRSVQRSSSAFVLLALLSWPALIIALVLSGPVCVNAAEAEGGPDAGEAKIYRRSADFVSPEQVDLSRVKDPKALVFDKMLITEHVKMGDGEPLRSELEVFVNCVQTGAAPEVGGADGRKAVAAAAEIVSQIQEHRWDAAK